jgi:hypothetical protein
MERALAITNGQVKYDPAFSPTLLPGLAFRHYMSPVSCAIG